MIEKGRHKKVDVEERFCYMCSEKKLEDELHFLPECHAYDRIISTKVALHKLITSLEYYHVRIKTSLMIL